MNLDYQYLPIHNSFPDKTTSSHSVLQHQNPVLLSLADLSARCFLSPPDWPELLFYDPCQKATFLYFSNNTFPFAKQLYIYSTLCTSGMLSIVGERESVHGKLEARTALRYVPCGLHNYCKETFKSKNISIKMLKDVGMTMAKSRETSAVYMQQDRGRGQYICSKTGDEGMQQ